MIDVGKSVDVVSRRFYPGGDTIGYIQVVGIVMGVRINWLRRRTFLVRYFPGGDTTQQTVDEWFPARELIELHDA